MLVLMMVCLSSLAVVRAVSDASYTFSTTPTTTRTTTRTTQQQQQQPQKQHSVKNIKKGKKKRMMEATEVRILAQKTVGRSQRPKQSQSQQQSQQQLQQQPQTTRTRTRTRTRKRNNNDYKKRNFQEKDEIFMNHFQARNRGQGQEENIISESMIRQETNLLETTEYKEYPLPAFAMTLRLRNNDHENDDDWDENDFATSLERVTKIHLQSIFQNSESHILEVHDEMFEDLKLSAKVRLISQEDDLKQIIVDDYHTGNNYQHSYVAAAFSGIVSYRFPKDSKTGESLVPDNHLVDMAITEILHKALVGENYLLLFRRYLSDPLLGQVDDVQDLSIGTEVLSVMDSNTVKSTAETEDKDDEHIHTITVVAIILFMTLSCLLVLFGSAVIFVMRDKKQIDQRHNEQAMASANDANDNATIATTDPHSEEGDSGAREQDALWKHHVLDMLRQFLVVRRQWRRQIRLLHRKAKKHWKKRRSDVLSFATNRRTMEKEQTTKGSSYPGDESYAYDFDFSDISNNDGAQSNKKVGEEEEEDDDGWDDSVYYDEDVRNDEAWLDEWSKTLTSIPLTKINSSPGKKKKDKATLAPRPAFRQARHLFLQSIDEEADSSSVVSSESSTISGTSGHGNKTKSSRLHLGVGTTLLEEGSESDSDEDKDCLATIIAKTGLENVPHNCEENEGRTKYFEKDSSPAQLKGNGNVDLQPLEDEKQGPRKSNEAVSDSMDGLEESALSDLGEIQTNNKGVDYSVDRALI